MANEANDFGAEQRRRRDGTNTKAQLFFEQLEQSIVTPHVGEQYRDAVKSILLRAIETGLYRPEQT